MGVTNSNKEISTDHISCDGSLKVTLALSAEPDIMANPTDIVLVLDRSGSMAGSPLENMKAGARKFIDIIDESTDSSQDGQIGSGSRIGIVSFADTATENASLITSVAELKTAVDSLRAGGSTNHADAFAEAGQLFDLSSTKHKVIVLFTDGKTTIGPPPSPVAASLRASGIVIYCIGLTGSDGIDVNTLNDWATDPDASHVAVTPDDAELEEIFADLAANISKPGATDIVIDEVVNPEFVITSVLPPSKGAASLVNADTLKWSIDALGTAASEGASLEFFIRHTVSTSGNKLVNQSITYTDAEHNSVTFPDPSVTVDCGIVVQPEQCPEPVDITIDGCQDSLVVNLGDTHLESLGRLLQVSATLKDVCPGKRVALAISLTEIDPCGEEHPRGFKAITIPAHNAPACRDVLVQCIKFVLPEDLNVSSCGCTGGMCGPRNLRVRLVSNYIDSAFHCCDSV
ncbi:MAG TPA: VWA domain-containing protein [Candidatus Fimivicinus intestinavium]|nr:VWA domain-containing protein [Candidatus Fimivicinus intestinavium]